MGSFYCSRAEEAAGTKMDHIPVLICVYPVMCGAGWYELANSASWFLHSHH